MLEFLDYRLLGDVISLEIIAILERFYSFLFILAQCFGHINADVYEQVSLAHTISLHCRQTFVAQSESLSGLCTWFNFHFHLGTFDGRNFHVSAQCCCWEIQQ